MNRKQKAVKGRTEQDPSEILRRLDPKEIEELERAFNLFNLEEGRVNVQDLIEEMESSDLHTRYKAGFALLHEAESGGEETLSFPEFIELMTTDVKTADSEQQLTRLFRLLDNEGAGFLDSDQVRHLFSEIGEDFDDEEWEKQFERLDQDSDGKFSYSDFLLAIGKVDEEEI